MSELKPCPFCGSKEVRQVEGDEYSWCMNPSCAIYDYEIRISEWNNRAESIELTTLREQVKVLREALAESVSVLEHCNVSTGYCCCGLRMTPHSFFVNGHVAKDFGEYSAELAIKTSKAALEQTKPKDGE